MTYSMQPIIKHLFQADTLEDVTRERLEAFVEEYPSFGIGHYLLSRKLRSADAAGDHFPGETRRTNLYFTNPFWLQLMLESPQDGGTRVSTPIVRPRPETVASATESEEPEAFTAAVGPEIVASATEPEINLSSPVR